MGLPQTTAVFIYFALASCLIFVEEIIAAVDIYNSVQDITCILCGETTEFSDLSEVDQDLIHAFYDQIDIRNQYRMKVMARESSIQLIYQNALLLYQYSYPALLELDYSNSWISPSSQGF